MPTDVSPRPTGPDAYLGDGVYASFDGHQIWLSVGHHLTRVVALEDRVVMSLIQYAVDRWGKSVIPEGVRNERQD
jgi:hypothetical protein